MADNKSGKRIIAIAVSPKAYDEILKLKGERTWTKWLLELMLLEKPGHEVLYTELSDLTKLKAEPKPKKAKAEKAKVERAKAEKISARLKARVEAKAEPEPEVEYGKVDPKTGGTWVDISKIGKHEEIEVGA